MRTTRNRFRTGSHKSTRPAGRSPWRFAARCLPGKSRPNATRLLAAASRTAAEVIRFHDRQPLLAGVQSGPHGNFGATMVQKQFPTAAAPPPGVSNAPAPSRVSMKNPTSLPAQRWSRQPDESGADFTLFLAWLALEKRRPLSTAAATLGATVGRLRRLSARHQWRMRAQAYEGFRADAAEAALRRALQAEEVDWQERAERFRDAEWRLRENMMQAGQAALDQFGRTRGRASVPSIVRLLDLASRLGRRATGLPESGAAPAAVDADAPPRPDFEAALRKVYGDPPTDPDLSSQLNLHGPA